jgi:cellulose synthase/poly-beta-1,6-N-acetylglucosamine synthase-like glycosyltransferase
MSTVLDLALTALGLLALVPALVLLAESLAARTVTAPRGSDAGGLPPRVCVLVPAHDERAGIGATVEALRAELAPGDRLVVIADNCRDETAAIVRALAANDPRLQVIERADPVRVGKGYAISFGVAHLEADPPEVVILVDADCRVSPGAVATLARRAVAAGAPIQGEYLLSAPADASPAARVSAFALLVRNQVRPRGLDRLGFPCLLTGSGMAFPWQVLRQAPATEGHLVEDMVLGLELALLGPAPRHCAEVQITSELPPDRRAGLRQRRRWEHGQLQVLGAYVPRLLAASLRQRRADLLALALELMVPPLALFVALEGGLLFAALVARVVFGGSFRPVALAAAGMTAVAVGVGAAWRRFASRTLRARELLFVPAYLLWKIPLYVAMGVKGRQRTWERTARRAEGDPPPPDPPSDSSRQ